MTDTKAPTRRTHSPTSPSIGAGASTSHATRGSPSKHAVATPPPFVAPPRVPTLDLKGKLAAALGRNGHKYWHALRQFGTAKISRDEFEDMARMCLKAEDVHLHNAFILGILYNASSAVPGPSATKNALSRAPGAQADGSSVHYSRNELKPDSSIGIHGYAYHDTTEHLSPKKRLRMIAASLTIAERQRISASGKPSDRSAATGSNTSSWAGAGADLLEKRRKEEEKKSKEAERKRNRETYTEVGSLDCTREALLEEATKQEVRAKLPVATLQALLRSSQVPSCSERKSLPEPEPLVDLMTPQAVEAGLSTGVALEASQLIIAGLQVRLQDLASSVIIATRANRLVGGIRLPAKRAARHAASAITSADDSFRSGPDESYVHSPAGVSSSEVPDDNQSHGASAYVIPMRIPQGGPRSSDQSSRTSTSSNSASTAASTIFTDGGATSRRHGQGADASVLSLASTAPTTVTRGNSEARSDAEMEFADQDATREERLTQKKLAVKPHNDVTSEDEDEADESMRSSDSSLNGRRLDGHQRSSDAFTAGLPHRPLYDTRVADPARASRRKLALRDVAFTYGLSPHISIEPPSLSTMRRLLTPDVDAVSYADSGDGEDADRGGSADIQQAANEAHVRSQQASLQHWKDTILREEEERLALAVRESALAKQGGASSTDSGRRRQVAGLRPASTAVDENDPAISRGPQHRKNVVVDQQGPLALLSQPTAASGEGQDDATINPTQSLLGKRQRSAPHFDPMSDVVDTTSLLAGLCD